MDQSEVYINELSHAIINVYKVCFEEMGYDLGPTNNEIEYHNYLAQDPIYFYRDDESLYENIDDIISEVDFSNYEGKLISVDQLIKAIPNANRNYAAAAISALDKYGGAVGLNDKAKLMILGQFAHESGGFRYISELGHGKDKSYGKPSGPYGKIYYGRGPIQITWESNYKVIAQQIFPKMGINADIHKDPDLCCRNFEIGCAASLAWFMIPGNGKIAAGAANNGNIVALTKAINGGMTGFMNRVELTKKIFEAVNT